MRSFSKLAAMSVIGAMSAFIASSAAASTWTYNGSKVSLEENGSKRRIVFSEPKAGLDKAGVSRGTVLFEGETKKNGRLSGYAKLFKAGCDPLDYFVEGSADSSKGEIVLQGQAPVFSSDSCKIKGYSEDSAASTLTFSSLGGGRSNSADRGYEQGDGGRSAQSNERYGRGNTTPTDQNGSSGRSAQGDERYGRSNANPGSTGQSEGYANNNNERNDSRQNSPRGNSQYDERDNEQRYGSSTGQGQYGQDDRYDSRDPRYRDYAERGSSRNNGRDTEEHDPRYDTDPQDDPDNDYVEQQTYRYRSYRRSYSPDWRDGTGR